MLIVVLLSLPFLYLVAFKPVLRRLAVRNANRRPRETALVLLGSLLGTAIITGSFLVGDTLDASIRQGAFTRLGPVDVIAVAPGSDAASLVDRARAAVPAELIDGILPIVQVTASVATTGADPLAEPTASMIEVDFAAAREFGGDPDATGIEGATPARGHAVIGRDLSRTLHVEAGDAIEAYVYGAKVSFVVDRVLARRGIAGFGLGPGSQAPNLFVTPGTIGELAGQGRPGAPPQAIAAVSNRGDVLGGLVLSEQVAGRLKAGVGAKGGGLGALFGGARVVEAKQQLLEFAEATGQQFTQLFGAIGFFSVLAGVLLLVNIFVMLAQERKTELGMLRAVGLRRASLIGSFSIEGWLYAIASSILGAIAGLGVGRLIVAAAAGLFSGRSSFVSVELSYDPSMASVQRGFTLGFVLSVMTVFFTSIWISRLNVIRAIRDLPDPEVHKQRPITLVLAALGALLGLFLLRAGLANERGIPLLLGPAFIGLSSTTLLRRVVPRRALVTIAAGAVIFWGVVAFEVVPGAFREGGVEVFVFLGVILTAGAVSLISMNQDVVGHIVAAVFGGSRSMALRLGLAYPLAKRFRTALILTSYALVIFTLTFLTVFNHTFSSQIESFTERVSGGFDIAMRSNPSNPVSADQLRTIPGVESVSVMRQTDAEFKIARLDDFMAWDLGSFDRSYVDTGPTQIDERLPQFHSDADVYRGVLADRTLIIVPNFFLSERGGGPPEAPPEVGDKLQLRDPLTGETRDLTVAGISNGGFGDSVPLIGPDLMDELFGDRAAANRAFIATPDGVDAQEVADRINGRFVENGADANSFRSVITDNFRQQQGFFQLMQGYLSLGLIIGIAGLGVVMVRAVRERRRQIGILRSLGFDAGAVRRAFVAESAFVALEGVLIGSSLAMVTAWRLLGNDRFGGDAQFSVPWIPMLLLISGTFIASLIATAAPAQQASRIRPAVALRMTD